MYVGHEARVQEAAETRQKPSWLCCTTEDVQRLQRNVGPFTNRSGDIEGNDTGPGSTRQWTPRCLERGSLPCQRLLWSTGDAFMELQIQSPSWTSVSHRCTLLHLTIKHVKNEEKQYWVQRWLTVCDDSSVPEHRVFTTSLLLSAM